MSKLVCTGCLTQQPEEELLWWSCPERESQPEIDHVLALQLAPKELRESWADIDTESNNPFIRYRKLSHTWRLAKRKGMSDSDYLIITQRLCDAIELVAGSRLQVTPFAYCGAADAQVKNETVNISGSHKARHLIATALHLQVCQALGLQTGEGEQELAIASCGNAALAAAVVAKAMNAPLRVFVPTSASESVLARLSALGATLVVCERQASDSDVAEEGDPCYLRFREAIGNKIAPSLPFSCQGPDNALALLGGHTLGWELIEQSANKPIDCLFVQVGGGALASGIIQAFGMAKEAGIITALPRFYAVQPQSAHPLARAWQKVSESGRTLTTATAINIAKRRSEYMWPWGTEPKSVAGGILDDETYDWHAIVVGLMASGGSVLTVSEEALTRAQELGELECQIAVDATGTAGLAGLMKLREQNELPTGANCAVLFTGALR